MQDPQLEPPGAGIPLYQQAFLRLYVRPFVAAKSVWEEDSGAFDDLARRILDAVSSAPAEKLEKRVLVPPQRGLEDSSRCWSVAMTLDHLTVVGRGISGLVTALSHNKAIERKVSTADVKPPAGISIVTALGAYEAFAKTAIADLDAKVGDRNSAARHEHPWFGAMTAHEWHWLLAQHQAIHYKQIREILKAA